MGFGWLVFNLERQPLPGQRVLPAAWRCRPAALRAWGSAITVIVDREQPPPPRSVPGVWPGWGRPSAGVSVGIPPPTGSPAGALAAPAPPLPGSPRARFAQARGGPYHRRWGGNGAGSGPFTGCCHRPIPRTRAAASAMHGQCVAAVRPGLTAFPRPDAFGGNSYPPHGMVRPAARPGL